MSMNRRSLLTALPAVLGLRAGRALASVPAPGGQVRFEPQITVKIGENPVRLVLTGTAMRTKWFLNVYALGSYVREGTKVRTAEELARVDVLKQLHLVFVRDVDGSTMAESFIEAIRMNHPAPAFDPELARLAEFFRARPVRTGDRIWLTWLPGSGLSCQTSGKGGVLIENPAFSRAAWEVYLGRNNLGAAIKDGLSSRL